jgi:hypothetical protein
MDKIDRNQRLTDIAKFIEELPDRALNMSKWFTAADGDEPTFKDTGVEGCDCGCNEASVDVSEYRGHLMRHDCGTAACVAGWAVALYGEPRDFGTPNSSGQKLLGLNSDEANDLFYSIYKDEAENEKFTKEEIVQKIRDIRDRDRD